MSENKPHLLMILNDMAWFWSHRLPLARAVLAYGWSLSLATSGAAGNSDLHGMSVKGIDLPEHKAGFHPLRELAILRAIHKTIRAARPDIVHAVTIRHAFYTGLVTRMMKYTPVVMTIAGLGTLFSSQSLKAKLLRFCLVPLLRLSFRREGVTIIFQNPDDRDALMKAGIIKGKDAALIRGSGVDLKAFPFTPEPAHASGQDKRPIVLFSSRLIREKGIYDFVQAARLLRARNVVARFLIAGDFYPKNPHSVPQERMQSWIDEGVIEWLGQCDNMPYVLSRSALVVLPSTYGEGVPKILLEAMATGRPIITTDLPGCRETVEHGLNGLLIPGQDPGALARAIEGLLNAPEKRAEMGIAGRQKAEKEFGVEDVVRKTLTVYDHALKGQAS